MVGGHRRRAFACMRKRQLLHARTHTHAPSHRLTRGADGAHAQGGGWYGINTNNRGIDFLTGTSPDTLECIMPPPRVGGGMWVLADGAPLCSIRLADLAPALYAGRDWPLVRVSVVHLADGGTALTGAHRPAAAAVGVGTDRLRHKGRRGSRACTGQQSLLTLARTPLMNSCCLCVAMHGLPCIAAVSMFHVVGDFASIRSLFQQWSAAFSSRPLKEQPTPYDRAVLEGLASKGGLDETALRVSSLRACCLQRRHAARGCGRHWLISYTTLAAAVTAWV